MAPIVAPNILRNVKQFLRPQVSPPISWSTALTPTPRSTRHCSLLWHAMWVSRMSMAIAPLSGSCWKAILERGINRFPGICRRCYGVSVTNGLIDWATTKSLILELSEATAVALKTWEPQ